jgi:hypothetical protein
MFECTATELRYFTSRHSETLQDISFINVDLIDCQSWHKVLRGILKKVVEITCFRFVDRWEDEGYEATNASDSKRIIGKLISISQSGGLAPRFQSYGVGAN